VYVTARHRYCISEPTQFSNNIYVESTICLLVWLLWTFIQHTEQPNMVKYGLHEHQCPQTYLYLWKTWKLYDITVNWLVCFCLPGREDISKLLSLQDRDDVSPPPGIFKRKPSPQSGGTKEEDDGMEYLDDEVSVAGCEEVMQMSWTVECSSSQQEQNSCSVFIRLQFLDFGLLYYWLLTVFETAVYNFVECLQYLRLRFITLLNACSIWDCDSVKIYVYKKLADSYSPPDLPG